MSKRGAKYVWGAAGPDVFDCSGLVVWAYAQAGVKGLPHFTGSLWARFPHVGKGEISPGDLVFPNPSHVGIAIGGGQMVVAPHTGAVVRTEAISTVWGVARVVSPGSAVNASTATPVGNPITDAQHVLSQLDAMASWISDPMNIARIGVFLWGVGFLGYGLYKLGAIPDSVKGVIPLGILK